MHPFPGSSVLKLHYVLNMVLVANIFTCIIYYLYLLIFNSRTILNTPLIGTRKPSIDHNNNVNRVAKYLVATNILHRRMMN